MVASGEQPDGQRHHLRRRPGHQPFGAGWTFGAGGPAVLRDRRGAARPTARAAGASTPAGGGTFTSPAGDNGTLSQSGGTYTYSTPDGETWTFDTTRDVPDRLVQRRRAVAVDLHLQRRQPGHDDGHRRHDRRRSTTAVGQGVGHRHGQRPDDDPGLDSGSNLTQVTNPDGGVETFSYDAQPPRDGRDVRQPAGVVGLRQQRGAGDDDLGRQRQPQRDHRTCPSRRRGSARRCAGRCRRSRPTPTGDVTLLQLDGQGRPLPGTAPNGGVTTWARNASGYVTSTTDPHGPDDDLRAGHAPATRRR